MPIKSPRPTPHFPAIDILSWIFNDKTYTYDREKPLYISVTGPKQQITGNQLLDLTRKVGRGLRELAGVKAGDVVLCASQNHLLYPAAVLGTICAGAIFTGSNPTYTEFELLHQLRDSGAKVIFASAITLPVVLACAAKLNIPKANIFVLDGPRNGVRGIQDLLRNQGQDWQKITDYQKLSSTTAVLLYSSGTTGLSKGCEITHWNLVTHSVSTILILDKVSAEKRHPQKKFPDPIYLAFLPFFHAFGLTYFVMNNARMGRLTYIVEQFTFPTILQAIERHRITDVVMAPPVAVLLAKSPIVKDYNISSLSNILCGAAPLGTELALAVEKVLDSSGAKNVKLHQGWGMSEVTCGGTMFDRGEWDERTGRLSVGHLAAGLEAMIVDDDAREVKQGEPGELWLRGPFVFKGYWRNEKATRNTITPEGWMKTGDIARIDGRGMFYIVERKKELIKVKGFQVAPAELEAALLLNPDVADAAVIGVPRINDGAEEPKAYVVRAQPNVTAASIEAWIADRLSPYKRLTGGVEFVDEIPKSASGKILRRILRERALKSNSRASRGVAKL
ncbi:acetyl-CoA synthetase-like protein [Sistotremastrum suecicum HHB10207 ss-3]|uniref:Acetyl-CoA synthetase-like protein n=1 Tax=Sistotremastrum suecicum HHB10207 ss-3 TaxID=1314776 RepID=A0A166GGG7_9AGAM|nr:acetyl-CoA synthetase-like protein [Sistotremastrum suecicum HHB10207 ss-3]